MDPASCGNTYQIDVVITWSMGHCGVGLCNKTHWPLGDAVVILNLYFTNTSQG